MSRLIEFRDATPDDAEAVAQLHAASWRRTYRGIYTDAFLDGNLVGNRRKIWTERLTERPADQLVRLVVDGDDLLGFVCGYGAEDERWGSFIDNLHVTADVQGRGLGSRLVRGAASWFAERHGEGPMYLWVLEDNANARAFYERIGASNAEMIRKQLHPRGRKGNVCRYVWPSTVDLAAAATGGTRRRRKQQPWTPMREKPQRENPQPQP